MPLSPDEIHKRTDNIYRSISEQYNPHLKTFLVSGRAYEKALAGVSLASKHYLDSMNKLGMIACDSTSTKDLGESMRHMSEMMRQIQSQHDEMAKFLNQEIIFPLENKLEHDQKYMIGLHKKYQSDYRLRTEDLDKVTMNHAKMKKKSFTGKSSYKYDEKQKQLAETVALKQKSLDQFQHDNLKQAFVEERRRYCFFVEQQCELVKKSIAYHQKAMESLSSQVPKWLESCADIRSLPENASALLDQAKPEDSNSIYSIPEPPSEPATQMNGFGHDSAFTARSMRESETRPVNTTGYNVIARENRKRVTAVFSHTVPASRTQLSFEKGDVIILMIPQPRDGWHYGENDRTKRRGWFPYSYTKPSDQNILSDKAQEPVHGQMHLPPADYSSTPASQQQNGNGSSQPTHRKTGPDPYQQMKDDFLNGHDGAANRSVKNSPEAFIF